MVGLGESYLPAFALALGHGEVFSGWMATAPMLAGALVQLATPWAVERVGSHRRFVVVCAAIQAAAFLPLCAAAFAGRLGAAAVFALATWYWAAGLAGGPAWNTWITTLVPTSIRSRYFAERSRWLQAAVMFALLGGGVALQIEQTQGRTMLAFAGMFLMAGAARARSAQLLAQHGEPSPMPAGYRRVHVGELLARLRLGRDGRLLAYLFALQIAAQIATPFFTPYLLAELDVPYGTYMALIATVYLGRVVALGWLGKVAHRHGALRVLWIGGIGLVPAVLPWILTDSLPALFAAQLATGAAWAAYELGLALAFWSHIPEHERTSVVTFFNLGNAASMAAGCLIGGTLLSQLGPDRAAYSHVFTVSMVARVLALGLLWRLARGEPKTPSRPGNGTSGASH